MLIIHAGIHKTGTTAIQTTLNGVSNDQLHVFTWNGTAQLSALFVLLFEDEPEKFLGFRRRGLGRTSLRLLRPRAEAMLIRQIRAHRGKICLFSAERIALSTPQAIARMLAFFEQHFDQIEIFAYYRPPVSYAHSMYQQLIKVGARRFFMPWPNYRASYEALAQGAGRHGLNSRVFRPDQLKDGDILADFLDWTGIPDPGRVPKRTNETLNATAVSMVFAANRLFKLPTSIPATRRRIRMIYRLGREMQGAKFRIADSALEGLLGDHAAELDWAIATFGPGISDADQLGRPRGDAPAFAPTFATAQDLMDCARANRAQLTPAHRIRSLPLPLIGRLSPLAPHAPEGREMAELTQALARF